MIEILPHLNILVVKVMVSWQNNNCFPKLRQYILYYNTEL